MFTRAVSKITVKAFMAMGCWLFQTARLQLVAVGLALILLSQQIIRSLPINCMVCNSNLGDWPGAAKTLFLQEAAVCWSQAGYVFY